MKTKQQKSDKTICLFEGKCFRTCKLEARELSCERLLLEGNSIGSEGVAQIAKHLQLPAGSQNLTHLDISSNKLSGSCVITLFEVQIMRKSVTY